MKTLKNNIIEEYDITRVIAVILVIIGHCEYYTVSTNYGGIDYLSIMNAMNIKDTMIHEILSFIISAIYTFHMPLFIALSGALFFIQMSKNKFNTLNELIKNKFSRLILPFVIVTLLYSVPLKLISGYYDITNLSKLLKDIILGQLLLMGNSHLWYLPSLFMSFIILYLMEKLFSDHEAIKIIILLLFHFASFKILIPLISDPLRYTIWFYMGYIFEKRREKCNEYIKENNKLLIASICIFIMTLVLERIIANSSLMRPIWIITLDCFCAVSGSFFTYNISYLIAAKTTFANNKYKKQISKNSFGMYLYSDTINYLVLLLFYKTFTISFFGGEMNSLIIFLARVIITGIISLLISKLLKKMKIKYIC